MRAIFIAILKGSVAVGGCSVFVITIRNIDTPTASAPKNIPELINGTPSTSPSIPPRIRSADNATTVPISDPRITLRVEDTS